MRYEKVRPYLKWFIYYFLLLLFLALQTTPKFFEIAGIKPVFVVPFMVCVCMFEDIVPSAFFSMVTGLFWDITSGKLLGFNAVILLCLGALISLLCVYYLHTKLLNSFFCCIVVVATQAFLDYIFHFAIWSTKDASLILTNNIIPTAIYTLIFIVPFFYLARSISRRLNDVTRV